MRWNLVGSSFALMFLAAYLDNARGPLLPVLGRLLEIPYTKASWLFVAGNLAAVAAGYLLIPLSRRYGERRLAILACAVGLLLPIAAWNVRGFPSYLLLASILGAIISIFGTLSNVLLIQGTDTLRRARYFCGLHMLYGVGSLVAPWVVASLLGWGPWHTCLWMTIPPLALLLTFFAFRFAPEPLEVIPEVSGHFSRRQWSGIGIMSGYVIAETLTSSWMVTYLVDGERLTVSAAAPYLSGFFLAMGVTRALCFFRLHPSHESAALGGSLLIPVLGLFLASNGHRWGLCLAGMCGPFFPVMIARLSRAFPEKSRALTITILASAQLALAIAQLAMGRAADRLGVTMAYRWLPAGLFVVVALAVWSSRRSFTAANASLR